MLTSASESFQWFGGHFVALSYIKSTAHRLNTQQNTILDNKYLA